MKGIMGFYENNGEKIKLKEHNAYRGDLDQNRETYYDTRYFLGRRNWY